jgi:cell fate (sporulation/competence/biofilm development) regulator YmcA (YheA/YmcA/DUF963 family)
MRSDQLSGMSLSVSRKVDAMRSSVLCCTGGRAYILRQYEGNKNPNQTLSLLKAVQWCRVAWNQYVSAKHIQQCFWKATIIKNPVAIDAIEQENTSAEIDELQDRIASLPHIDDYMSVQEFINPADQPTDDKEDDIMASVVDRYNIVKKTQ